MSTELYPCPACGFLEFSGPPGTYEICSLCGWEDDHVQLANPRLRGGANRESLAEAQLEALVRYPLPVAEAQGSRRDPEWRPLTNADSVIATDAPKSPTDYFFAACGDSPTYYWRRTATAAG